jgi:signal transduction histidine kinase
VIVVVTLLMIPGVRGAEGVHGWVALVALPFGTVPLYWRRRHPAAVLAVLGVAFVAIALDARGQIDAGLVFGIYAAALYGSRRVRVVAAVLALGLCGLGLGVLLADSTQVALPLGHIVISDIAAGVAWVLGDRTRTRRAYVAELEERSRMLEHDRDENVRRATEEERSRIARELHDVVTHSVSVIAVQAGAGRRTAEINPGRSLEVLATIERTARSTLGELRALLGVLRRDNDESTLRRPQPTVGELPGLIDEMGNAGLRVELHFDGTARTLDGVLDVCAYRVVQEALTNVMKHASGAHACVRVGFEEDGLGITVVDDGPGPAEALGPGHGLIGMRERVELVGGRLRTGRDAAGGFRVHAELPYAASFTPVSLIGPTSSGEDHTPR